MSKSTGKRLLETFFGEKGKPTIIPPKVDVAVGQRPVFHGPQETVPVPAIMSHLKRDDRGFLVPYFVAWIDGKPEFRCVRHGAVKRCLQDHLCWICGEPHYRNPDHTYSQTYLIGPMCLVNRISAEPGSHIECARYSVKVCPFLSAPKMRRNEKDLPELACDPGGLFIKRNPGAIVAWTTSRFDIIPDKGSLLFRLDDPTHLEFWREGRKATRAEVLESIQTGLPILEGEAKTQGPEATDQLRRMVVNALDLVIRNT